MHDRSWNAGESLLPNARTQPRAPAPPAPLPPWIGAVERTSFGFINSEPLAAPAPIHRGGGSERDRIGKREFASKLSPLRNWPDKVAKPDYRDPPSETNLLSSRRYCVWYPLLFSVTDQLFSGQLSLNSR